MSARATALDGLDALALAAFIGAPRVEHHASLGSTMDRAHQLAEGGAPSGTVVVADEQLTGRGRQGRRWQSERGHGLWCTSIHRDVPVSGLDVLSLRIGLGVARALDAFAPVRVGLKWPNDLLIELRKLGGILVEARWRDVTVEWVAVGIGINVALPEAQPEATSLRAGTKRSDVLHAIFPAVVSACSTAGEFTAEEMQAYADRDAMRDMRLTEPAAGVARGITTAGALIVETATGTELFRRGSLVRARDGG